MLEDPRGNFFIAVWDHVGLTGDREPHADPVSSLWHKITLSRSRHLTKESEFRLPFFRMVVKDLYLVPRSRHYAGHKYSYQFLPITPELLLRFTDQRHIVAFHHEKCGAVTAAILSTVCSFTKPWTTELCLLSQAAQLSAPPTAAFGFWASHQGLTRLCSRR